MFAQRPGSRWTVGRIVALCATLGLVLAACGNDDDPADTAAEDAAAVAEAEAVEEEGTDDPGGADPQNVPGSCEDIGNDAMLNISMDGAITEAIDTSALNLRCGGAFEADGLSLVWIGPELEFVLSGVEIGEEEIGEGLTGDFSVTQDSDTYASEPGGCTVEITENVAGPSPEIWTVEGFATCGDLTQAGGDGTVTVDGEIVFTGYAVGS